MKTRKAFQDLATSLLQDPHGISEEAFGALLDLATLLDPSGTLGESIANRTDATDGRFYFPE